MDEEIKLYQSEGSELEPSNLINRENYDIGRLIFSVRDTQVILDKDLAKLYGVETKVLNQAALFSRGVFSGRKPRALASMAMALSDMAKQE